ncbi:peroxisomal membrane protein PMP34 [Scaptodrosophila lebanonensis]|uniref:Peroxisomal membrane protein PMP34 n=1 Tax=Drosophila lebanonensis TaxID=7225 RepID=A0A6J2T4Y1_DROLE|nr:peroxisomal membrane protein PMP34 [Scaptodrosophila lebanonensis]
MVAHSKLNQIFSYQNWVHAVSGAAGGCIAMSTFYPLDTVRSRLQLEESGEVRSTRQVIKEIVLREGVASLYRGLGPVLQSLCISNFVYFYTFHALKAVASNGSPAHQSAFKDLVLGSIAGIINVFTTTPFWVVNTRLRMRDVAGTSDEINKHYKNLLAGLRYVAKTEGVKGLWSGTIPSLILVSNPALQFMMYEMLKRNVMKFTGGEVGSLGFFVIGAIAKAFATVLTYPLQLVQTKQRHRSKEANDASTSRQAASRKQDVGMMELMISILQHQGVRGLFRGLEAKILQTVLTAALMFMAYEKIASTVGLLLKRNA